MNSKQIAEMQADMQAGTPGDWRLVKCNCGHPSCPYYGTSNGNFPQGAGYDLADARRIARVPLMEATIIAQAAEIARLTGLMNERMQMLERYNAMVKEAMDREDVWRARTALASKEVERLEFALAVYACRCIGFLPDCAQGDKAGCGWTARAALEQKQ